MRKTNGGWCGVIRIHCSNLIDAHPVSLHTLRGKAAMACLRLAVHLKLAVPHDKPLEVYFLLKSLLLDIHYNFYWLVVKHTRRHTMPYFCQKYTLPKSCSSHKESTFCTKAINKTTSRKYSKRYSSNFHEGFIFLFCFL